jgi:hypothetical protein
LLFLLACGGSEASRQPPPGPAIASFAPASPFVTSGAGTTLATSFTGGTGTVDDGVGAIASGIPDPVGPLTADTTFTLTVAGDGTSVTRSATVQVVPPPSAPVITASAGILAGGAEYSASVPLQFATTYDWTIAGGTITQGQGTAEILFTADPEGTLQLLCVAVNAAGTRSGSGTITIQVQPGPVAQQAPVITRFTATPSVIQRGQPVTLSWSVQGAARLDLGPGIGVVTGSSLTIWPGRPDSYVLTATNPAGSDTARVEVEVFR